MIIFVLLSSVFGIILYHWINLIWDYRKHNIPGPFPLPIVGNCHKLMVKPENFLTVLTQLSNTYKGTTTLYLFSLRFAIISHPKVIEAIASSTELITKGISYKFLHNWLGLGLLTASGERWKTHRKFLTPAFHFNILQTFLPVFLRNQKILIRKLEKLSDGQPVDLFPIIALNALDNVAESIMGVNVHAQEQSESEYVKAIQEASEVTSLRMRNAFMAQDFIYNMTPYKTREDKAVKILHAHTNKVIEARKQELKKLNITTLQHSSDLGLKNKSAFLDLLLLTNEDGKGFDDVSIREEVDTFMFEGHDTTTSGIVYCLYCLSKYQDVQDKIVDELNSILGDNTDRDLTYSELHEMKYLEQVIKESLRLFPSVPLIQRSVTRDIEIAGLRFLKDTALLIDIFNLQRNPDLYEDPLEFRPDRFDRNINRNPYSWIAFSSGPRNCIGQKFAMMEMKVVISSVVKHFELLSVDNKHVSDIQLTADLVIKTPNGVNVQLLPRK